MSAYRHKTAEFFSKLSSFLNSHLTNSDNRQRLSLALSLDEQCLFDIFQPEFLPSIDLESLLIIADALGYDLSISFTKKLQDTKEFPDVFSDV